MNNLSDQEGHRHDIHIESLITTLYYIFCEHLPIYYKLLYSSRVLYLYTKVLFIYIKCTYCCELFLFTINYFEFLSTINSFFMCFSIFQSLIFLTFSKWHLVFLGRRRPRRHPLRLPSIGCVPLRVALPNRIFLFFFFFFFDLF